MASKFTSSSSQYLSSIFSISPYPLTISCWFNAENTTANQALVYIGLSTSTSRFLLVASGAVTNDPISFDVIAGGGGAAQSANTTTGYNANTWSHACGVATSSNLRTVYLNGGSSGTNTTSVTPSTPNRLTIGSRLATGIPGLFFDGSIAEVGIWNDALTAAEIASLANGMTCDKVRPQSLVFYAPLVRDLIDQKGGVTITNNNSATVANHPRVYA
jgi:hypothetical protein